MIRRTALSLLLVMGPLALGAVGCGEEPPNTPPPAPPTPPPPPPVAQPYTPLPEYITIRDRIEFETDSAVLLPQSYPIIDDVVVVLKENPQIHVVEIQGHTDTDGDPKENLLLSENRARSVMAYIVSRGIDARRLTVRGFGDRIPVRPNDSEPNKLQNRRVEFRIVKQGPT
jgi:outer membrane protein OmpA-like peptidoglycan-associated protein